MDGGRARRAAAALAGTGLCVFALPEPALAHGIVARADLPIPRWLFVWAAIVVLIVSFVALGSLWKRPKLEDGGWRPLSPALGRVLSSLPAQVLTGAAGVVLLGIVVWSGFQGFQTPTDNFAPTFVYVVFWVGLVGASVLFGDVFRAFNPWRAIARAVGWGAGVARRGRPAPPPLPYPERAGRWPAAVGLLGFAYMELAATNGAEPRTLAIATIVYSLVTLLAMSVYGVDAWLERGEAFSVYFNLFSRISPFELRGRVLGLRRPLSGLTRLDATVPGTVALLAVVIGSVTYDGASEGPIWANRKQSLAQFFLDHGLTSGTAVTLASALGLGACVLLVLTLYSAGIAGVRHATREGHDGRVAGAFVHSLVPIAVAYVGAHYLTFLLTQGQAILPLSSDPLGHGWNLFGTADRVVNFGIIGVTATWYAQVALVVGGHVAGLASAHDRALARYSVARLATRSQYWMLGVMVAFTFMALTLLAQAQI
jgi:hypothetical protein